MSYLLFFDTMLPTFVFWHQLLWSPLVTKKKKRRLDFDERENSALFQPVSDLKELLSFFDFIRSWTKNAWPVLRKC